MTDRQNGREVEGRGARAPVKGAHGMFTWSGNIFRDERSFKLLYVLRLQKTHPPDFSSYLSLVLRWCVCSVSKRSQNNFLKLV